MVCWASFCHAVALFWASSWRDNKCKSIKKYKELEVPHVEVLIVAGALSQHGPKISLVDKKSLESDRSYLKR